MGAAVGCLVWLGKSRRQRHVASRLFVPGPQMIRYTQPRLSTSSFPKSSSLSSMYSGMSLSILSPTPDA